MRARAIVFPLAVLILVTLGVGSLHETGGSSGRLVAFDSFPEPDAMTCEWEVATPAAPSSCSARGAAAPRPRRRHWCRPPPRPGPAPVHPGSANAVFSAVTVDPARNEVILTDENRFRIFVFDRLANSGPVVADRTQESHRRPEHGDPVSELGLRRSGHRRHLRDQQRHRPRSLDLPAHRAGRRASGADDADGVRELQRRGGRRTAGAVLHRPAQRRGDGVQQGGIRPQQRRGGADDPREEHAAGRSRTASPSTPSGRSSTSPTGARRASSSATQAPAAPSTRRPRFPAAASSCRRRSPSTRRTPTRMSRRCASSRGRRPASTGRRTSPSTRSAASSTSRTPAATPAGVRRQRPGRRGADSRPEGRADRAAVPDRRVLRPGERRGVGREFRRPLGDRLRQGRERRRGAEARHPQCAARRADSGHQQPVLDCLRSRPRGSHRAELRGESRRSACSRAPPTRPLRRRAGSSDRTASSIAPCTA